MSRLFASKGHSLIEFIVDLDCALDPPKQKMKVADPSDPRRKELSQTGIKGGKDVQRPVGDAFPSLCQTCRFELIEN